MSDRQLAADFRNRLTQEVSKFGSVAQLCSDANVNRQQFAKYMSGDHLPSLAVSARIAAALGISLSHLIGDITPQNPVPGGSLDALFKDMTQAEPRYVEEGYYFEASRFTEDEDVYLFSASKMTRTEFGGLYSRYNAGERIDGTVVPQFFKGQYYENAGKICLFFANTEVPSTFGSSMLRRLDMYSADLIGLKSVHMFHGGPQPATNPVVMKFLGTDVDEDDLRARSHIYRRNECPKEMKHLIDHAQNVMRYTGTRMVI